MPGKTLSVLFTISQIISLVNLLLGFILALFCARSMRFFKELGDWWKRLLVLAFFFIFHEISVFSGLGLLEGITKAVFIAYFIYILSFTVQIIKEIEKTKGEVEALKSRLTKMKGKELKELEKL